MQLFLSYKSGLIEVRVPTDFLNSGDAADAPLQLQVKLDDDSTEFQSVNWVASVDGSFTVYTTTANSSWTEVEVMPLFDTNSANYINFPATGFTPQGSERAVPLSDGSAPTLLENGIQQVYVKPDNSPLALGGTEVAYSIKFSEIVSLPTTPSDLMVLFGGVPSDATISVTPVGPVGPHGASEWFVLVNKAQSADYVDLTLQPRLQVVDLDPLSSTAGPVPTDAGSLSGPGGTLFWTKVTLNGDLYSSTAPIAMPLNLNIKPDPGSNLAGQVVMVDSIATSSTEDNVVYIGTAVDLASYAQTGYSVELVENGSFTEPRFGGYIKDFEGNLFVPPSSIPSVEASLDQLTATKITLTTLSNSAGAPGIAVDEQGRVLDTVDFRSLPSDRLIVNAQSGYATINYLGDTYLVNIKDYDRYILSDRGSMEGVDFVGTADSEYVIVGNGGDNYLDAENQQSYLLPASADDAYIEAQILAGNFKAETDIVDYSRSLSAINVNLGDFWKDGAYSPAGWTEVYYQSGADRDYIRGFEGVVGSTFDDFITGSDLGNFIAGGAGDDVLMGYSRDESSNSDNDPLYSPGSFYYENISQTETAFRDAQYDLDTRDILVGGEGYDFLFGGAGGDILIDFDGAQMWGSDILGRNADDRMRAEYDMFVVRGDGDQKATINEFHLSKDGTGLAGRSKTANDSIVFSIDTAKLGAAAATHMAAFDTTSPGATEAQRTAHLYEYVYPKLTFERKLSDPDQNGNRDLELRVLFKTELDVPGVLVGSTIVADVGDELMGGQNQTGVVELAWLAEAMRDDHNGYNQSIDMDMLGLTGGTEFLSELNVAIALELQRAGTVRGANQFGVMAASLDDERLVDRYYNPGAADEKIIGTKGDETYEYKVQDFESDGATDNSAGDDIIFDIGGTDDKLMFERARLEDLKFEAVKVGRESGKDSLKIDYTQTDELDAGPVTNAGTVTWQGHFQHGGRQTVEVLELGTPNSSQLFSLARAEYAYDHRGRVISDSKKIVADDTYFAAIMVGDEAGVDEFVIDANLGFARVAGFSANDKLAVAGGTVQGISFDDSDSDGVAEEAILQVNDGTSDSAIRLSFQGFALTNSGQADLELALGITSQP